MNKNFSPAAWRILLCVLLLGLASLPLFSQETARPFSINESPLPAPVSPVMDYAGVLDANTKQTLEQKIIAFRDSSNPKTELAVAIVSTTNDRPIFDYSLAVARGWKIGSKEQDNPSALLFIAVNDRKYFTQVSKDLEDELPDGLVGQLQRQYLVPAFKQGDYGKGVSDTIDAYIRTIRAKQSGAPIPEATTQEKQKRGAPSLSSIFCCLIILFFVLLPILSLFGSKKNKRGGGGGFGGGSAADALPWVVGSILANSGSSSSSSSSSDWGGSSSGGSDWGGFGGGGDFGGGGAGGDW